MVRKGQWYGRKGQPGGGWARNSNDNTGDDDEGVRPTDGSGITDGNPNDKTTFRADATISRLFNMVPIEDHFIITKANMPQDCGPPTGKPRPPSFTGVSKKTSIDIPCGHLAEDHPVRGYSSGITARGGNMAFLRVTPGKMGEPTSTFVDSTGQNCKGDYVWLYDGFNREQWAKTMATIKTASTHVDLFQRAYEDLTLALTRQPTGRWLFWTRDRSRAIKDLIQPGLWTKERTACTAGRYIVWEVLKRTRWTLKATEPQRAPAPPGAVYAVIASALHTSKSDGRLRITRKHITVDYYDASRPPSYHDHAVPPQII
ncbi:MAG: sister chromatid cohesion protein 1 [Watsoniomyces obsoletus]|nr:MAG: sister chromatid cohesion protein 1 [Watsoniomyces obsoletus]